MRVLRVFVIAIVVAASVGLGGSASVGAATNGDFADLVSVSCPGPTSCFAFGFKIVGGVAKSVIEHWNGSVWSVMATPSTPAPGNVVYGGACASTSSCFAVGDVETETTSEPFTLRWNGASWSSISAPAPAGATAATLFSVACADATHCLAVGRNGAFNGPANTLVERWNGAHWAVVPSPNVAGSNENELHGVTCARVNLCFAVGSTNFDGGKVLIERWNGIKMSRSATPNTSGALSGVACRSTTRCFAVGGIELVGDQTVVERFDGSTWSDVASPVAPGDSGHSFAGVTCANPAPTCFAVGFSNEFVGTTSSTLIEQWQGGHWKILPTPNLGPAHASNALSSVACATATTCFAVGSVANTPGGTTVIEGWNGTTWALSPHPQPVP